MAVAIAFLRGINVGGNKTVSMPDLKAALETAGLAPVKTHLNSGNVVFEAGALSGETAAEAVRQAVKDSAGVDCHVQLRSAAQLEQTLKADPFPETESSKLQINFLDRAPAKAAFEALQAKIAGPERLKLDGDVIYGAFPDGVSASELFKVNWPKLLGVEVTARNRNTVQKLVEIAQAMER